MKIAIMTKLPWMLLEVKKHQNLVNTHKMMVVMMLKVTMMMKLKVTMMMKNLKVTMMKKKKKLMKKKKYSGSKKMNLKIVLNHVNKIYFKLLTTILLKKNLMNLKMHIKNV